MPDVDQDPTAARRRPPYRDPRCGSGAGVAAVGATALAACGGDSSASTSGTPAAGSVQRPAAPRRRRSGGSGGTRASAKADIPVGGGTIIAAAKTVVTQPTAGEFKAFSSICTHMGCPVAEVSDGTIDCNCHGSQYDIATGAVKRGTGHQAAPGRRR